MIVDTENGGILMETKAVVGEWYQTAAGERFEVVAIDEDEATIEIQYFNGDVEELDQDSWSFIRVQNIPAPEDWSGPFDDLERDDFGDTERPYHPDDYTPLETFESENEALEDWDEE